MTVSCCYTSLLWCRCVNWNIKFQVFTLLIRLTWSWSWDDVNETSTKYNTEQITFYPTLLLNELQNEICTFLAKGFVESRPSEDSILKADKYFIKLKKFAKDVLA